MKIYLKLFCYGMLDDLLEFEKDFPEGSTVNDVLTDCLNTIDAITPEIYEGSYMINNKAVSKGTPLQDGDQLTVIRILEGG